MVLFERQPFYNTMFFQVNASTFELKEGGVRLQLTIVDTPGFGDNIDNTDW